MQRRIGRRRARVRNIHRAATFCVLWLLMRKRNAAPLLWRLIQQMSITWTKPAQQSFCEKRPQNIHCPHNPFSTFARETIFHKCVIWCPQLATISCERWRLCFSKADVCPSRKHTHMSNPHLDLSEVFNIHPAVRKAYWQNAPIKLAIKEETCEYTRKTRNMRTDTFLMHAMRKCILHIQAAVYLKIKSLIRVNISVWIIFDRHTMKLASFKSNNFSACLLIFYSQLNDRPAVVSTFDGQEILTPMQTDTKLK